MAVAAGTALAAPVLALAQSDVAVATPVAAAPVQSGYAAVNGLRMYYEIHGSGEPLLLLHGAFGAIDLWGAMLTTLAERHQVIAVELQGHGRTADIDRAFSYEQLADDIAALMAHLAIPPADLVGYSMGADAALQVAIHAMCRFWGQVHTDLPWAVMSRNPLEVPRGPGELHYSRAVCGG